MVPLDGVDLRSGGRRVAEGAGIAGVHRDVEELDGVAAASGEERSR